MLTIDHPPANAIGKAVATGLAASMDDVEATRAKVVVVRSATPGYFAVGADIDHMATIDREGFIAYLRAARGAIERLASSRLVSIAAVDGYALGGGLELALACTMRVASPTAELGLPEVKLGLLPGAGGTQRLPRLIGRGPALDLLITGRTVDAQEAHRLGLVDRVAGEGAVEAESLAVAARLAKLSRPALSAITKCVDAAQSLSFSDGMALEEEAIVDLFCDGEAAEGIAAFLEKRPPVFA